MAESCYPVYLNGRAEMKTTILYKIEPVVKYDRRSLAEMEAYARTLTPDPEQLVMLAVAMQHIVNNILYEIDEAK